MIDERLLLKDETSLQTQEKNNSVTFLNVGFFTKEASRMRRWNRLIGCDWVEAARDNKILLTLISSQTVVFAY